MSQEDFILKLQKGCQGLRATISSNKVFNLNYSGNDLDYTGCIQRSSSQWQNFADDVRTYFSIYQDNDLEWGAQQLLNEPTIDETWVERMSVFLHRMENQLVAEKLKQGQGPVAKPVKKAVGNQVFIVHGHDTEAKLAVARTLEKLNYKPIILHEQATRGKTIIEKIEEYSDVSFAVVLYTPCDLGRAKELAPDQDKARARQNVVFEHGYLIGKLGRQHVCALVKGDIETPGDMSGIVYVPMDDAGAWKYALGKEMKSVGLAVDLNSL